MLGKAFLLDLGHVWNAEWLDCADQDLGVGEVMVLAWYLNTPAAAGVRHPHPPRV